MCPTSAIVSRFIVVVMAMAMAICLPDPLGNSVAQARESDQLLPQPETNKKPKEKKTDIKKTPAENKTTTGERKTRKSTAKKRRVVADKRRHPREASVDGLPRDAGENRFVANQVIIRFRLSAAQSAMDNLVRRLNLRHEAGRTFQLAGATLHLYTIIGGASVRQVISTLQSDATVVTAQPNYIYTLQQTTSSTANDAQYALSRLGIADVHKVTRGAGAKIAVIDSGIDFSHPELAANAYVALSVTSEENPLPHKHGTSIAGIIASEQTLTGIAPDAPVIGIRAFDTTSDAPASTSWLIASALEMAHKNGADIINMSFAGPHDPLIERGVAGAAKRGMIAVAAAGNGGPEAAPLYPAAYDDVIAVTAIDSKDGLFGGANRGDYITLSAPGVDILAPSPNGGYGVSTGTSMAAAHVSGLIALLLSRKPDLSREKLLEILGASATDLGAPGTDSEFGFGLPAMSAAIKALEL